MAFPLHHIIRAHLFTITYQLKSHEHNTTQRMNSFGWIHILHYSAEQVVRMVAANQFPAT